MAGSSTSTAGAAASNPDQNAATSANPSATEQTNPSATTSNNDQNAGVGQSGAASNQNAGQGTAATSNQNAATSGTVDQNGVRHITDMPENGQKSGNLPQTASPLPLLALLGVGSFGAGLLTRRKK
jgi:LPXTG-motif cell wall-anchored protein